MKLNLTRKQFNSDLKRNGRTPLTELEYAVWKNPFSDFSQMASEFNRSLASIEKAYDRAMLKIQRAR